ncbi:MAG: ribonuclease Z [Muribaculaceae bacterium]|nr:ribonuclease Z [Muribaculaceae bacterium]
MIHTLGCGSAKPTLRHQPSCTVVEHHDNLYMVDCGEGAQHAFQKQRLKMSRLNHIFLTHLHGDHVFGIFGLIGTLALQSKGGNMVVHTFEEGRKILEQVNSYFNRDTPYKIEYNILNPTQEEIAFENNVLKVRTVPLLHRVNCVGYIFEEKEKARHLNREMCDFHQVPVSLYRDIKFGADLVKPDGTVIANEILTREATKAMSYAHLSDTAYYPELAEKVGPVDLMMHETTYLEDQIADAAKRGHSTAKQAAMTARDAGARWLLTGHYSSRYRDDEKFKTEAEEIFPRVILNREGLRVDLKSL